jgi:Family of unknown function (DUF6600)/FecR protein
MKRAAVVAVLLAAVAGVAAASSEDDLTSLSYISYMERYATIQPATQQDSLEAVINMPLIPGDRIDTAREARAEIQLADGSTLWLDEYTSVSLDAIAFSRGSAAERTSLYLAAGNAVLSIPESSAVTNATRVDAQSATVHLNRPGLYRLNALRDGGLRVEVWSGLAELATPEGGELLRTGGAAELAAGRVMRHENTLTGDDVFARWVAQRQEPLPGDAGDHIEVRYARQGALLDSYGRWVYVDDSDVWAWQPTVSPSWSPYSAGRWYWTPVGWNWLSYEPWGWLPYHYGSWFFEASFGWVWTWDSLWSPAWVDWMWWPGHVGWCPRGYYSHWYWHQYGEHRHGQRGISPDRRRPPRSVPGRGTAGINRRSPVPASRFALDFRGRVRPGQVDPRGWNVVRSDDFASPHLNRLVRPAREVLPPADSPVRGIVTSGALVTPSPVMLRPAEGLEVTFGDVGRGSLNDLTPILERSGSLTPDQARQLARPTTTVDLTRRDIAREPRISPARPAAAGGPASTVVPPARREAPNVYRPALRWDAGAAPAAGVGRANAAPRTRVVPEAVSPNRVAPSRVAPSRPSVAPGTSRRQGGASAPPARSTSARPAPSRVTPRPPQSSFGRTVIVPRLPSSGSTTIRSSRSYRGTVVSPSVRRYATSPRPSVSARPSFSRSTPRVSRSAPRVSRSAPSRPSSSRSSSSSSVRARPRK